MNINSTNAGIIGIIVGVAGFGFGIYRDIKASRLSEKIGLSISQVEEKTQIDVDQAVIDKAVQNAVERRVSAAVSETVNGVRNDIHEEIESKVRKSVTEAYERLTADVSDKISEQVAAIDEYALRDKVVRKAQDIVVKKTETGINGVLSDFNHYLNDVKKFYDGVTRMISPVQQNAPEVPRLRFRNDY